MGCEMLNTLITIGLFATFLWIAWLRRPQDYLNALKVMIAFGALCVAKAVVISESALAGTILYASVGGAVVGLATSALIFDRALDPKRGRKNV